MTVYKAFYFMLLEKMQRAIKKKKKRMARGALRGRVKYVHLILSINALQHQTAGQFRASSRLPSSWYRSELFLSERKGSNDSRAISGDFRTFCLPFTRLPVCPKKSLRLPEEEWKKRVNDIRERQRVCSLDRKRV